MKQNYKIVIFVTSLLLFLSSILSFVNYNETLKIAQKQIKEQSLPLSLDNIYTHIQKNIIEPHLVASMMANDTFVKNWLINNEKNKNEISIYLDSIKNKNNFFTTFLISEKTKKYYTHDGILEKIDDTKIDNQWYFRFKKFGKESEINLDYNNKIDHALMMFINYKIFDKNNHFMGVTGVARKVSYINDMLQMLKQKYQLNVYIFKKSGQILLSHQNNNTINNINDIYFFKDHQQKLVSKVATTLTYKHDNETYFLHTKYISELDLYILAEAKLSNYTHSIIQTLYLNIFISFFITLVIAFIIISVIRKSNKNLEILSQTDGLTNLLNRRAFTEHLERFLKLSLRQKSSIGILFLDIDNFKKINDTLGHAIGDDVLKRVAVLLNKLSRESDLVARWGGEEFVIAFIDISTDELQRISEKICLHIEKDFKLIKLTQHKVTGSFGITSSQKMDTTSTLISRADEAMYLAKRNGKNQVIKR